MRTVAWVALAIVLVGGGPGPAAAQFSRTCNPVLQSAGEGRHYDMGDGRVHQFLRGGVIIRCAGQNTVIRSDSLAWYPELDRLEFVGSVRFQDSVTVLDATSARYFPSNERLEALGDVRLEDTRSGSILTGPQLTYYREAAGLRDTAELFATRRPRVEYRSRTRPSEVAYVIRGERVRLRGADQAWAGGDVTIDRDDFAAHADSAALDLGGAGGVLVGKAEASGTDSAGYTIRGRRIAFGLVDDALTWVQAQGEAEATSADWHAIGDTITFDIDNDKIQGGALWGSATRAQAMSAEQTIQGDSLALDAPDQVLTEVRAFGRTRATTMVDSVADIEDWLEGDSLVARFDEFETGERGLAQLRARGNARSLYHVYPEGVDDPPAINYSRGRQITAYFTAGTLERVDIVDKADGVYLEPI
ncbi:MAG: hypothetical protein OER89_16265, partial [Gemmatimonadota bacterium]|nr:hypothetical protein [Gemmatimonadota bacterium]